MSAAPPVDADAASTEPPDDDTLAAELVLGVLSGQERRSAQARAHSDPAFAERVAAWERRFSPWLEEVAAVAPPEEAWRQIRRRLGWEGESAPRGVWQTLGFWRGATAVTALAAVGLWLTRPPAVPPTARQPAVTVRPVGSKPVTALARDDGSPGWLASVDAKSGTLLVVPNPSAADSQGRVPELWIIANGKAPQSLGSVSTRHSSIVQVPADARAGLTQGAVLAVTLEAPAGIPHKAPTGPIIAKGVVTTS